MNLSRAAKKFRAQMPEQPEAPKPAKAKKKAKTPPAPVPLPMPQPAVEAVTPIEPLPEPLAEVPAEVVEPAPVPTAQPKVGWPAKAKRPRFVREKAEKREQPTAPALPPRSTKFVARLLTKNLALPPKDDGLTAIR